MKMRQSHLPVRDRFEHGTSLDAGARASCRRGQPFARPPGSGYPAVGYGPLQWCWRSASTVTVVSSRSQCSSALDPHLVARRTPTRPLSIDAPPMPRRSLKPQLNQICAWVHQGRTDAWIAHHLKSPQRVARVRKSVRPFGRRRQRRLERSDLRDEIEAESKPTARRRGGRGAEPRPRVTATGWRGVKGGGDRSRRRRRRAVAAARPSQSLRRPSDHGETDGYGLWLDARSGQPIYGEHSASTRSHGADHPTYLSARRPAEILPTTTRTTPRGSRPVSLRRGCGPGVVAGAAQVGPERPVGQGLCFVLRPPGESIRSAAHSRFPPVEVGELRAVKGRPDATAAVRAGWLSTRSRGGPAGSPIPPAHAPPPIGKAGWRADRPSPRIYPSATSPIGPRK